MPRTAHAFIGKIVTPILYAPNTPIRSRVGIYLVVSFGVHNYKVQKAWEEKQLEGKLIQQENEALKASLLNKEWIEGVEKKVRASKPAQNVLQSELEANINATIASIAVADKTKTGQSAPAAAVDPLSKALEAELSAAGTLPAGVKVSSSDSGRVI